jgi:hypothetical protein
MVAANYFSAWIGFVLIMGNCQSLPVTINNGRQWFWGLAGIAYLLTALLEWPFVAFCLRSTGKTLWRGHGLVPVLEKQ